MAACCIYLLLGVLTLVDVASSIACYKCASINGSNPACEDFFQGEIEGGAPLLQAPCYTSARARQGRFMATHCIKLVAYSADPEPIQYVYRTCSRDEGDDNDITRTSHCGFIKLHWINPNRRLRGCLHICDKDACNQAGSRTSSMGTLLFGLFVVSLVRRCTSSPMFAFE